MGFDLHKLYEDPDIAEYLVGNRLFDGSEVKNYNQPLCHNYCGFQFGVWASQLGDGRAHTLGHIKTSNGYIQLQLKGSGKTPFSRFADGNAVLRSSIRQFLASQALFALNIPTTRAASVILTDDYAQRDVDYSGKIINQKCAVVLRTAQTFVRFGSFQICNQGSQSNNPGPSYNNPQLIKKLADYILKYFYTQFYQKENKYFEMYKEICRRTASLIALWQCYGFCHGVLNTDNMSIMGLTIDYGPYGFMEYFDKNHISNSSDEKGRYSYRNQPKIGKWNLQKLAFALKFLHSEQEMITYLNSQYEEQFKKIYYNKMKEKLGLVGKGQQIHNLIDQLFDVMDVCGSRFHKVFRVIVQYLKKQNPNPQTLIDQLLKQSAPKHILNKRNQIFNLEYIRKLKQMLAKWPHLVSVIGMTGDQLIQLEQQIINCQKQRQEDPKKKWTTWVKQYLSLVSPNKENISLMQKVNPMYILYNHIAQKAITECEEGNFNAVNDILEVLMQGKGNTSYWQQQSYQICVSCSS